MSNNEAYQVNILQKYNINSSTLTFWDKVKLQKKITPKRKKVDLGLDIMTPLRYNTTINQKKRN